MQKNLRLLVGATAGLVTAIAFSSCAYDPYYTSVGGSYSTGYGPGYGYGGSSFSTSVFIGTGDPRWGYDPGCYSYYDYRSRRYYDPYLNGYYPIGYRPPVVYGMSHPYGWRPGSGYLRPPSRVSNVTISNYRNRESAYRNSGYIPGGAVGQKPFAPGGTYGQQPHQMPYGGNRYQGGPNSGYPPSMSPPSRQIQGTNPFVQPERQGTRSGGFPGNVAPPASRYNNPVTSSQPQFSRGNRSMPGAPPAAQTQIRPLAPPDLSRGNPRGIQPQGQPTPPQMQQMQPKGPQGSGKPGQPPADGAEFRRPGRY